jgi:ferrochelatase
MRLPPYRQDRLDPARPAGLLLCGMGGPDGPDDVQPFLRNLFSDPRIIPIPRPVAPLVARLIARRRAPAVRARYALLDHGGGSPQLDATRRQAERLAALAMEANLVWLPAVAMRYWHPFPDEAVAELRRRGAGQYLVVPMYPQYADATSGSTLDFVLDALADGHADAPVHVLADWATLPGLVESLATTAAAALRGWIESGAESSHCALLFVAHSLPERFVTAGDPYLERTRATVSAVHADLRARMPGHDAWLDRMPGGAAPLLSFQSRVGPIRWLGPDVVAETRRLAAAGCRRLHVQPLSFTCEHVETLHELDMELRATALAAGVTHFSRGAALNLDEAWLASLATHLRHAAYGREVPTHA